MSTERLPRPRVVGRAIGDGARSAAAAVGLLGRGLGQVLAILAAIAIGLGVPLAIYVGFYAVANSRLFLVDEVVVEGNSHVSESATLAAVGLDRPRNVLTLDPVEMESALEAMPWVYDARVEVESRGAVAIEITESVPVATIVAGGLHLLGSEGEVIRPWRAQDGMVGPLLFGVASTDATGTISVNGDASSDALRAVERFEETGIGQTRDIREVHIDAVMGMTIVLDDGAEVRLGDDRFEERLYRLEQVYDVLLREHRTPETIVLDGPDLSRVAVRLEGGVGVDATDSVGGR